MATDALTKRSKLRRWAVRQKRRVEATGAVVRRPLYVPPGHFYSPITGPADVDRALAWSRSPTSIDMREDEQARMLQALTPYLTSFVPPRYPVRNSQFGLADAAILHGMLRHYDPKRLIEVGSGFSTMVSLDTSDAHLPELEITCIEPYTERLFTLLPSGGAGRIHLVQEPIQEVGLDIFSGLGAGDVLFIDSTHVVKAGSDVVWEILHILPTLAPGVLVHIHDIHWPFEYPARWLREQRDWTEAYLLHAFLAYNEAWPIRLMTSWAATCRPELLPPHLRGLPTASLWIQRTDGPHPAHPEPSADQGPGTATGA